MSFLGQWWRQPQKVWLRRALFQVHLWTGVGTGIYILLISISGSVLVFRIELHKKFARGPVMVAGSGTPLTQDELKAAAQRAFPDYQVDQVWKNKNPNQAIEVWMERNGKHKQRILDPYTGADLGPSEPAGVRLILWLADLHDNLLYRETGRFINGFGAVFLTLLCLTGAVIWWPGIASWRRSLTIDLRANWKRINWGMHNAIGFWIFALIFLWALSGIYLVWPDPFAAVVDYLEPYNEFQRDARAGDEVLRWVARLHFGRFAGWPVKTLWTVLGLVPLVLFITGAVMWWNRVLRRSTATQTAQSLPESVMARAPMLLETAETDEPRITRI